MRAPFILGSRFSVLGLSLLILSLPAASAQPLALPDLDDPPVAGRPGDFNGAVGRSFRIEMKLAKADLVVGQPFTLTVRVAAVGPWARPPLRPPLHELADVQKRFQIDRPASDQPDRALPDRRHDQGNDPRRRVRQAPCLRTTPVEQQAWEFDYQLRPLSPSVADIPGFAFTWFQPPPVPGLRGRFPTTFADELAVKVESPKETAPPTALQAPESFFRIATGPAVLRDESLARLPGLPVLTLYLFGPPALAAGWYLAWKRRYPDAARQARIRQSRAAREALLALGLTKAATPERVTAIAAVYLRHRFGLPAAEPTPAEVLEHLEEAGAPVPLAERAAEFFRACDAARFAPPPFEGGDLVAAAKGFILTLEGETWSHS